MFEGQTFTIREETPEDSTGVWDVNEQAFGGPEESKLVARLHVAGNVAFSLVAVLDGRIIGHILFSPVAIEQSPENCRGIGLAPMSVLPNFQDRGVGSRLVREGLDACRRLGYDVVVVLGHPEYYPRFGFTRAKDHGLENEYGATDAFMVTELKKGMLKDVKGLVKYGVEFQGL